MKKVLGLLLAGMFFAALNAQAHCGKCGMEDGAHKDDKGAMVSAKVDKLAKELSLTDEQKGKVEGIIKEKMEKKQQLMEEHHKSMDALQEDFKAKLGGVLSAEQMAKWEDMKKDHGKDCPDCKDGKICKTCKMKKAMDKMGDCPKCKDGKMCKKCKMKKAKEEKEEHEHNHKE